MNERESFQPAREMMAYSNSILALGRKNGRMILVRAFRDIAQTDASDKTFENETRLH